MSFILDALKKSESERQRQSGPGVFQPRIASPRARFPLWAIGIGLLLGINLIVLIWVMTRSEPEPPMAVQPRVAAPATGGAAAAPAAVPAPPAATAGPAVTKFNPPLIVDPSVAADLAAAAEPADDAPAAGAATGPFNANDYVPAVPAGTRSTTPLGTDAGGSTGAAPSSYATRESLLARGQQVPEAALSLHVYDANPARRFVFVNGQRGTEGDSLPNGLRIEQIVPEGAVLSWNGNRFLVPIQ